MSIESTLNICAQIYQQGKHPSMALIKAKSQQSLSIPEIVSALSHWKQLEESEKHLLVSKLDKPVQIAKGCSSVQEATLNDTDNALQQKVLELERELSDLRKELKELKLWVTKIVDQ